MIELNDDWISQGTLDFEYKQYELLSYLQKVEYKFNSLELYPYYSDLIRHFDLLMEYKSNKEDFIDSFPKEIVENNLTGTSLTIYDLKLTDEYILNINKLIDFALIKFRKLISLGILIYDEVKKAIEIVDLNKDSGYKKNGYIMIEDENINIYKYEIGNLDELNSNVGIKTKIIRKYPTKYKLSYESIKQDLLKTTKMINPPLYLIKTPIKYPTENTLLPVLKRILVERLIQPK